jgi:hypothetical protein
MSDTRVLRIPEELCRQAETKFGLRFATVDEMVTAMLAEMLRESEIMDQAEEKIIAERLKSLGYI